MEDMGNAGSGSPPCQEAKHVEEEEDPAARTSLLEHLRALPPKGPALFGYAPPTFLVIGSRALQRHCQQVAEVSDADPMRDRVINESTDCDIVMFPHVLLQWLEQTPAEQLSVLAWSCGRDVQVRPGGVEQPSVHPGSSVSLLYRPQSDNDDVGARAGTCVLLDIEVADEERSSATLLLRLMDMASFTSRHRARLTTDLRGAAIHAPVDLLAALKWSHILLPHVHSSLERWRVHVEDLHRLHSVGAPLDLPVITDLDNTLFVLIRLRLAEMAAIRGVPCPDLLQLQDSSAPFVEEEWDRARAAAAATRAEPLAHELAALCAQWSRAGRTSLVWQSIVCWPQLTRPAPASADVAEVETKAQPLPRPASPAPTPESPHSDASTRNDSTHKYLSGLPFDLFAVVVSFLPCAPLCSMRGVSNALYTALRPEHPSLWLRLYRRAMPGEKSAGMANAECAYLSLLIAKEVKWRWRQGVSPVQSTPLGVLDVALPAPLALQDVLELAVHLRQLVRQSRHHSSGLGTGSSADSNALIKKRELAALHGTVPPWFRLSLAFASMESTGEGRVCIWAPQPQQHSSWEVRSFRLTFRYGHYGNSRCEVERLLMEITADGHTTSIDNLLMLGVSLGKWGVDPVTPASKKKRDDLLALSLPGAAAAGLSDAHRLSLLLGVPSILALATCILLHPKATVLKKQLFGSLKSVI